MHIQRALEVPMPVPVLQSEEEVYPGDYVQHYRHGIGRVCDPHQGQQPGLLRVDFTEPWEPGGFTRGSGAVYVAPDTLEWMDPDGDAVLSWLQPEDDDEEN